MPAKFVDFRAVKSRVSIRDVLARYGALDSLKDKGHGKLVGSCPIHHGDNPNGFHVSTEKNVFNCFSQCGGGNVLDLVAKIEGLSIRDAALKLAEWFNVPGRETDGARQERSQTEKGTAREIDGARGGSQRAETEDRPVAEANGSGTETQRGARAVTGDTKAAPDRSQTEVNPPLDHELKTLDPKHPYLRERGLTDETIRTFGVGFCSRGLMKNRIAIPIRRSEDGVLVAYAGRAVTAELAKEEGKYKLPAGFEKSRVVWNLDRADWGKDLIVVEGFFDCMKVWQAGFQNVVALMGSSLSDHQEQLLVGSTDRLTLMLDGDEAGEKCVREFYRRLRRRLFLREVHLEPGEQPDGLTSERIRKLMEVKP